MSAADDLAYLSLTELADRLARQELTSTAATEAQLARIAELEPRLHSYALVTAERARARARQADAEIAAGRYRGPLHGVPIAVKDLCYTAGIATAAGTTIHRGFVPDHDATVVTRLELAGAVILGKLQMTEGAFAEHHPEVTPPVNPWHPEYWTGVSSSGSGVATAAGLCYGSLGSDTGGSIRYPSTANGITGLKPSWGRVSRHGVFALADSLDHIGPMTRSAADAAAMLAAIAGPDPHDPTSLNAPVPDYLAELDEGIAGLSIGIDSRFLAENCAPEVAEILTRAVDVLAAAGARIAEVHWPDFRLMAQLWTAACGAETALAHEATYPARAGEYGKMLSGLIDLGRSLSAVELARIARERAAFAGQLERLFDHVDLLALPAMPVPPMTNRQRSEMRSTPERSADVLLFTAPFDFSGTPTITLPAGFSAAGLPIGFQLAGARLEEALLLRAGHCFQQLTDWHLRRPPILA